MSPEESLKPRPTYKPLAWPLPLQSQPLHGAPQPPHQVPVVPRSLVAASLQV